MLPGRRFFRKNQIVAKPTIVPTKSMSEFLFNTGSSVDWQQAKSRIISRFREEDCWDLVEVPIGMGIADANGAIAPIVEVIFNEVEPVFDEINFRNNFLANVTQIRDQLNAFVTDSAMAAAAKAAKLHDNELDYIKGRGKVEQAVFDARKAIGSEYSAYQNRKREFAKKVAACIKTFNSIFGPSAKSRIETTGMFAEKRFRQCWFDLDLHYSTGVGSTTSSQTQVLGMIKSAVFNGRDLGEHVQYLNGLLVQCDQMGLGFSEKIKTQFLVDSINKSGPNRYTKVLELHDQLGTEWSEVYGKLQDIDSKIAISRTENGNGNHHRGVSVHAVYGDADDDDDGGREPALLNFVGDGGKHKKGFKSHGKGPIKKFELKKCTKCGKNGHLADACWSDKTCPKCGQKCHLAPNCRSRVTVAAIESGNKVQLSNVFANKIPKPSKK
jgi:hypothetical protein